MSENHIGVVDIEASGSVVGIDQIRFIVYQCTISSSMSTKLHKHHLPAVSPAFLPMPFVRPLKCSSVAGTRHASSETVR